MLQCYFDDSGTDAASQTLSYGGLIGTAEQWRAFDNAWKELLKNPLHGKPPLTAFHLSQCAASQSEFKSYTPVERDAVRFNFRKPIIDCGLSAVSYAVLKKEWDELIVGDTRDYFGSSEQIVFTGCVNAAFNVAGELGHDQLDICFDLGRKSPELDSLCDRVQRDHSGPVSLNRIVFEKVADFPGLQGADTIATESFWLAQDYANGKGTSPSAHFQSLLNGIHAGGHIMDRPHILENLVRFNKKYIGDVEHLPIAF